MSERPNAQSIWSQREAIKKAYGNTAAINKKVNLMLPQEVTNLYLSLKARKQI